MFEAHKEGRSSDPPPFRFLYMSGAATERDQTKTPGWMPDYCLMRVSAEYEPLSLFCCGVSRGSSRF